MPKDAHPVVKAIVKAERELSKLSPAEIARDTLPPTLPLALETANFITDWLKRFVDELKRR